MVKIRLLKILEDKKSQKIAFSLNNLFLTVSVFYFFDVSDVGALSIYTSVAYLFNYIFSFNYENNILIKGNYKSIYNSVVTYWFIIHLLFFVLDAILFDFNYKFFISYSFLFNTFRAFLFTTSQRNFISNKFLIYFFVILSLTGTIITNFIFNDIVFSRVVVLSILIILSLFLTKFSIDFNEYLILIKRNYSFLIHNFTKWVRTYSDKLILNMFIDYEVIGIVDLVQKGTSIVTILNNTIKNIKLQTLSIQVFENRYNLFFKEPITMLVLTVLTFLSGIFLNDYLLISALVLIQQFATWITLPFFFIEDTKYLIITGLIMLIPIIICLILFETYNLENKTWVYYFLLFSFELLSIFLILLKRYDSSFRFRTT